MEISNSNLQIFFFSYQSLDLGSFPFLICYRNLYRFVCRLCYYKIIYFTFNKIVCVLLQEEELLYSNFPTLISSFYHIIRCSSYLDHDRWLPWWDLISTLNYILYGFIVVFAFYSVISFLNFSKMMQYLLFKEFRFRFYFLFKNTLTIIIIIFFF